MGTDRKGSRGLRAWDASASVPASPVPQRRAEERDSRRLPNPAQWLVGRWHRGCSCSGRVACFYRARGSGGARGPTVFCSCMPLSIMPVGGAARTSIDCGLRGRRIGAPRSRPASASSGAGERRASDYSSWHEALDCPVGGAGAGAARRTVPPASPWRGVTPTGASKNMATSPRDKVIRELQAEDKASRSVATAVGPGHPRRPGKLGLATTGRSRPLAIPAWRPVAATPRRRRVSTGRETRCRQEVRSQSVHVMPCRSQVLEISTSQPIPWPNDEVAPQHAATALNAHQNGKQAAQPPGGPPHGLDLPGSAQPPARPRQQQQGCIAPSPTISITPQSSIRREPPSWTWPGPAHLPRPPRRSSEKKKSFQTVSFVFPKINCL